MALTCCSRSLYLQPSSLQQQSVLCLSHVAITHGCCSPSHALSMLAVLHLESQLHGSCQASPCPRRFLHAACCPSSGLPQVLQFLASAPWPRQHAQECVATWVLFPPHAWSFCCSLIRWCCMLHVKCLSLHLHLLGSRFKCL